MFLHLVHENLANTVLQQRRSHLGLQVFHQALLVNPGVDKVCVELVPDGAKARPAGFDHDEGDGLVAGDNEGDDNVDHDVEEVAVVDAGGEVVAEVERVFLEERDAEGDLGVQRAEVVRLEVDQEAGICILQELEERTKECDPRGPEEMNILFSWMWGHYSHFGRLRDLAFSCRRPLEMCPTS
ncbi:uncharacterized protein HKW66_Vig0112080 [Vigna angularis]|uniref:Uncharacterized protein n=1 Tax=Phaseolus angularis TaxID=3914 RepID=A0A8T0KX12_PHAAN|nr:uncharacterized protein HKW66_Vig0112080 [Vigna angularis]